MAGCSPGPGDERSYIKDLQAKGLLDQTPVFLGAEFGNGYNRVVEPGTVPGHW
jgi:hypothetical protein